MYSIDCATLCIKSEVMLQANQDSWLKAKAGARIPVKTINKSTHTNIFIYSIFLFGIKLELCRTAMLYVRCFPARGNTFHGIFSVDLKYVLCIVREENISTVKSSVLPRFVLKHVQIAYEGDFWSLCTVTFWQKVDFLISNTC